MGQHDDRIDALALQLGRIFLNRRDLFLGTQEFHTGCTGWRYFAWRCFGHNSDEADLHAANFFTT